MSEEMSQQFMIMPGALSIVIPLLVSLPPRNVGPRIGACFVYNISAPSFPLTMFAPQVGAHFDFGKKPPSPQFNVGARVSTHFQPDFLLSRNCSADSISTLQRGDGGRGRGDDA